jgi:hypothetical protein
MGKKKERFLEKLGECYSISTKNGTLPYYILIVISLSFLLNSTNRYMPSSLYADESYTMCWFRCPIGSRANAMGANYVALAEDVSAIYWNPAGLGFSDYMEVAFSWEPWWFEGENRFFGGFTMKIRNIGTVGVGYQHFDYGIVEAWDDEEKIFREYHLFEYTATLSYSRQFLNILSLGISVKVIEIPFFSSSRAQTGTVAFDFGALQRFLFSPDSVRTHKLSVGVSLSNLGGVIKYFRKDIIISNGNYIASPERIFRIGFAYQVSFKIKTKNVDLEITELTFSSEYASILNEPGWSTFGFGMEITLLEFGSIRFGKRFALRKLKKEAYNKEPFSWGIGFFVPLHRLSTIPLEIGYDYGRHRGFWAVNDPVHTWFMRYIF